MAKIFLDTNVVLDIILKRNPFFDEAIALIDLALEDDRIQLFFADCSIPNIIYISRKELTRGQGIERLIAFIESYNLASGTKQVYLQAMESKFPDKEDAVQYHIALHNKCDYFITRDTGDFLKFASASLPVFTPMQFADEMDLSK